MLQYREIAVLSAFGDDSADERQQRVFCVAAVVGRECDWKEIDGPWRDSLGGRDFHGKDCETDRGEFAATSHEDNLRLYAKLASLLSQSKLFGYSHAVNLVAVKEVFGDGLLWDSPFYFCFTRVLHDCARNGYVSFPQERVELTLDNRRESEYNAAQLYEGARNMPDWKYSPFLADKLSFASRKVLGIQVADLMAREGMKALDRHVGQSRALRGSLMTILKGRRFKFKMYDREYLDQVKEQVEKMEAPFSQQAYRSWLQAKGVVDNHSNRIAWLWEANGANETDDPDDE